MMQTAVVTPTSLTRLSADIMRGYDALIHERFGTLTARQRQRLEEIRLPVHYVKHAVDDYEMVAAIASDLRPTDPRYRLLYGARTPLEMVLQCSYFLLTHHMRRTERMNPDQVEAVHLMERSGRKLIQLVEHLWVEMRTEQQAST
jgi:hypothetical protein